MRHLNYFLIVTLLLASFVSAETTFYDDDNLGLIKIETPDSPIQRMIQGLSNAFSITPVLKTPKVGEANTIKIVTEVPCKDSSGKTLKDSDVSSAKFILTDPDLKTSIIDIKSKVLGNGVCKSEKIDLTVTPNKKGKYRVHYVVMQSIYPQLLVKEINEFTVSSGSPQCQKEELTTWKPSAFVTENGVISEQSHYVYDLNCNLDRLKSTTSYKTQCDNGFLIVGSSQSLSSGIKHCEEKVVEQSSLEGISSEQPSSEEIPTEIGINQILLTEDILNSNTATGTLGEISLYDQIFGLQFYGYATYSLLGLTLIGTVLVLSIKPIKKRR